MGGVFANELMSSADLMGAKEWKITVYGQTVETKPEIDVNNVDAIQIPTISGGSTVFSAANAVIELEEKFHATIANFLFRPKDGLSYGIKIGQIRGFVVGFSSGSQTNSLEANKNGFLWGANVKWNVSQGTMVSPAVALDFSLVNKSVPLDKFEAGGVTSPTDKMFEQDEYQLALNFSKRWKSLEPYGGLKGSRTVTRLKDGTTKECVRGEKDGISPFLGFQWDVFPGETIVVEGSLAEEKSFSAGMSLKF